MKNKATNYCFYQLKVLDQSLSRGCEPALYPNVSCEHL